ncbi:PAS domain-containing protein [Plantactinospora sp. S1510]|uniref:Sensor-like histidine kinase SenX3 n=1 Tax=Plantactinospora alkalitolerans TaxID=2789879 RepID=A0ABS0GY39_9ACTN|nr:ATP-binding protein [Plantactinospora alkalitolerans]MBF9131110.1 PAS domain-containing protein [Plantactinospora alkalitolerans]
MPDRPDYPCLIAGHADVIEMLNAGEVGLPVLNRLLQVAAQALGAAGMAFVEYGPSGGRVVSANGAAGWAVGRPIRPLDEATSELLCGPRVQSLRIDALPGELAEQLDGRGLRYMISARAEVGGLTIGTLYALYRDAIRSDDAEYQVALGYLASSAAHMYGDQAGLPVHGDGTVVAALADGLAIVTRDGTVQLWNPAAEKVTGLRAAELLDRPLPFPVPPPGQVLDHRLPDGRWLKITSGELPGAGAARVVTFRDSSDQHVRDHDRDLFVAVTSHELRTPVTVIKGYADTLDAHWESLSESDRRQAAGLIGQRAGELARLVDRLLSTTNDVGPVGGSPPVPFDLVETLRAAATDLPADLRHRLVLQLPDDLPKALGDRASLATVLTELTTNAGKYSPDGSPVQLTAEADKRTVAFRVSDRGIGVRPEHVERAFERFWQGESGDRRRYPGAGLGLYLVRRIVERQNGWVSLRPRDGGGTVAEVRLPRG